jgi:hypothetical protein
VTADATRVVDDLGPLHRLVLQLFVHRSRVRNSLMRANYIMQSKVWPRIYADYKDSK